MSTSIPAADHCVFRAIVSGRAEASRQLTGTDASPGYARAALHASLAHLGTDHLDVWQLHLSDLDPAEAEDLVAVCEEHDLAPIARSPWRWASSATGSPRRR